MNISRDVLNCYTEDASSIPLGLSHIDRNHETVGNFLKKTTSLLILLDEILN